MIATILNVARRNAVNAVLCAGDLFDDPTPATDFWEGLATTFRDRTGPHPPVFWSQAITIRLRPSRCGLRVTRFARSFRHGCMLLTGMTSRMNLRLT